MKITNGPDLTNMIALVDAHAATLREAIVPREKAAIYGMKEAEAKAFLATQYSGRDRAVGPLLQAEVDATRGGLDTAANDIVARARVAREALAVIEREARKTKIAIRATTNAVEALQIFNAYKERNP